MAYVDNNDEIDYQFKDPINVTLSPPKITDEDCKQFVKEKNFAEFMKRTPNPDVVDYADCDSQFKHSLSCTLRLNANYIPLGLTNLGIFGAMNISKTFQGFWFSDDPNKKTTDKIVTANHCVHKYMRYRLYRRDFVPCNKYYPSLFKASLKSIFATPFRDRDYYETKRDDWSSLVPKIAVKLDTENVQSFGDHEDGVILQYHDYERERGQQESELFMIPPTDEQQQMLETAILRENENENENENGPIFGWCFNLLPGDLRLGGYKPPHWSKGDQLIDDTDLMRHFRIYSDALSGLMPGKPSELKRPIHRFKVSTGKCVKYDPQTDIFRMKISAFYGMSGGPVTSTLLPPNVAVGIGGGGKYRNYQNDSFHSYCLGFKALQIVKKVKVHL